MHGYRQRVGADVDLDDPGRWMPRAGSGPARGLPLLGFSDSSLHSVQLELQVRRHDLEAR
jgi:hypothetical protein